MTEKKDKEKRKNKVCRTSIGGQAVLEGVMMRGESSVATAVRTSTGEIQIETSRVKSAKEKNIFFRLPFIRGVVNLCTQLFSGTKILLRSAEVYGDFAEPSKFDNFIAKKTKINPMNVLMGFSVILGVFLAVALFVILPNVFTGLIFEIPGIVKNETLRVLYESLMEAGFMLVIFIIYLLLVTAVKDVRRVFMYHGAEHRTINCYEYGEELTVENVQKQSTAHSRCGTTFTFFVIMISIIVFALVNWMLKAVGILHFSNIINGLIKIPFKLLFLPIIAGISYELLKFLARFDNIFARILRAPGMLLQKLTTKKPTDDMAEVAIAAFKMVLKMDADRSMPTQKFKIRIPYEIARKRIKDLGNIKDETDLDFMFSETLGVRRSELFKVEMIEGKTYEELISLAQKMQNGMPLSYALGYQDFYGYKISVNENVLIPRPETEELCEKTLSYLNKNKTCLDMCTGSGAIAVTLALKTGAKITAVDISSEALEVAKINAINNDVEIDFIESDMFEKVDKKFDVIVSNPPYIKSKDMLSLDDSVKNFEPKIALDGGKDGLDFYRILARDAFSHLNKGGVLCMEIGFDESEAVKNLFSGKDVKVEKDIEGKDRIVIVKEVVNESK